MADDAVLGFDSVLESLPSIGALSPHQERIAAGVAMIKQGETYRNVSAKVGVSVGCLAKYVHGGSNSEHSGKGVKVAEAAIQSLALENSIQASHNINEGLNIEPGMPGSYKPSETVKALQVSAHIAGRMLGWDKSGGDGNERSRDALAGALQQLQQGAKISIEQPDKVAEAIEVEATPVPPRPEMSEQDWEES